MSLSLLKRCSTSIASFNLTPASATASGESRRSSALFSSTSSLYRTSRLGLVRFGTFPFDKKSSCTSQITDEDDAASRTVCTEYDTASAQQEAKKTSMATKSRVQHLRNFLGLASPALNALEDDEKEEYTNWQAYDKQEHEMIERYKEIAEAPADVEVMLRGWRVEHPPPELSAPVLALVAEESAARTSAAIQSGNNTLPPLSEDIFWNALQLIPTPPASVRCEICGQGTASTYPALRVLYRLPCGHLLHVKCLEENYERWLGNVCPCEKKDGTRDCIRCKGLRELTKDLSKEEIGARIRRVGDTLLDWRGNKRAG